MRDVFLTCGATACSTQAAGQASDGFGFYTTSTGTPQSAGQLGAQLGALTLGG